MCPKKYPLVAVKSASEAAESGKISLSKYLQNTSLPRLYSNKLLPGNTELIKLPTMWTVTYTLQQWISVARDKRSETISKFEMIVHVLFLANIRSPLRVRCWSWYCSTSVSAGSLMLILSKLR